MVIQITRLGAQPEARQEDGPAPTPFRLFESLFNDWAARTALAHRERAWAPPVDLIVHDNKLIIRTEIPGVDEKDLEVKLDGETLTIRGEKKPEAEGSGFVYHRVEGFYGTFARSFDLPASADAQNISAAYRNGVLAITIPQKPEVQPRVIQVNV